MDERLLEGPWAILYPDVCRSTAPRNAHREAPVPNPGSSDGTLVFRNDDDDVADNDISVVAADNNNDDKVVDNNNDSDADESDNVFDPWLDVFGYEEEGVLDPLRAPFFQQQCPGADDRGAIISGSSGAPSHPFLRAAIDFEGLFLRNVPANGHCMYVAFSRAAENVGGITLDGVTVDDLRKNVAERAEMLCPDVGEDLVVATIAAAVAGMDHANGCGPDGWGDHTALEVLARAYDVQVRVFDNLSGAIIDVGVVGAARPVLNLYRNADHYQWLTRAADDASNGGSSSAHSPGPALKRRKVSSEGCADD